MVSCRNKGRIVSECDLASLQAPISSILSETQEARPKDIRGIYPPPPKQNRSKDRNQLKPLYALTYDFPRHFSDFFLQYDRRFLKHYYNVLSRCCAP